MRFARARCARRSSRRLRSNSRSLRKHLRRPFRATAASVFAFGGRDRHYFAIAALRQLPGNRLPAFQRRQGRLCSRPGSRESEQIEVLPEFSRPIESVVTSADSRYPPDESAAGCRRFLRASREKPTRDPGGKSRMKPTVSLMIISCSRGSRSRREVGSSVANIRCSARTSLLVSAFSSVDLPAFV